MKTRQVITIGPDGSMSGLQRKPGQGIDLRSFGHAEIERASLIEWDADAQAWYINVLQGHGRGVVTWDALRDALGPKEAVALLDSTQKYSFPKEYDPQVFFAEYDDAVKVEIAYLDALRLQGKF